MSIKYIADTHLFDSSSLLWRTTYLGLDDYANELIRSWNEYTKEDDIVIHAGDVGEQCERTKEVLRELKGRKVLVLGNHDVECGYIKWPEDIFQGVYWRLANNGVYITHKPEDLPTNYSYIVHGHHHTYEGVSMLAAYNQYVRDTYRLNCAADLIGNRPLTLNELIICKEKLISRRKL